MLPPDQPKYLPHKKQSDTTPDHPMNQPAHQDHGEGHPHGAQPAALSAAPSLTTLLHAFRRAWRLAVPVAFLGALAAAAVAWMVVPPQYTSSVDFRILSRPSGGQAEEEGMFAHVQKAQVALLKSYDVLNETIEKSRVAELHGVKMTPAKLSKQLITAFNVGPEIMNVMLQSDSPEAAVALLNALGDTYPKRVNDAEEARVRAKIAQLEKKLVIEPAGRESGRAPTLAEQLRDKRVELAAAEHDAGLDDTATINARAAQAQTMLATTTTALRDLTVQLSGLEADAQAKEKRATETIRVNVSDTEAEDSLRNNQAYIDLSRQIAALQARMDDIRATTSKRFLDQKLAAPREAMVPLNRSMSRLMDAEREKIASKRRGDKREAYLAEARVMRDKAEAAKRQKVTLEAEIARCHRQVEEHKLGGPKAPPEIEALRDQLKQMERESNLSGDILASLKGSIPLTPRVTKHTEVFVPTEKEYGRPIKFALAAGVVSFGFLLVGMCLLEARGRRIYASDDVMQGLGMRVVGTLPRLPASARTKSAQAQSLGGLDSQFGMTEAIDAIRTVILHAPRVDGARIVMVTSAATGEGKTTLAGHLAASLARAWRKTLLIDGDLRNPVQHVQFDQQPEPGLCEVLRGEVEADDAVRPTLTSRLWMMPAGKLDTHSLQALAQESVNGIFDRLKEQYDFIVLDTSPVLPVPDALLLGKQADVVLMSVMKDHSRMPAVFQAQQRLESLGIRVLGTVVIGEKTEAYGHAVPYPRA